jgi:hypothetical protein
MQVFSSLSIIASILIVAITLMYMYERMKRKESERKQKEIEREFARVKLPKALRTFKTRDEMMAYVNDCQFTSSNAISGANRGYTAEYINKSSASGNVNKGYINLSTLRRSMLVGAVPTMKAYHYDLASEDMYGVVLNGIFLNDQEVSVHRFIYFMCL